MKMCVILWFILAVFPFTGFCFQSGAPTDSCLTMYPHHGSAVHQTTETPFTITVDKATYLPDDELTVTISSPTNTKFKGIEMKVHRLHGNTEILEGTFIDFPTDKLQTLSCFGRHANLITHRNGEQVTSLTIKWQAPHYNVGDIQFTATIVESFSVFWFNVNVLVLAGSNATIVHPVFQLPNIPAEFIPINYNTCGTTKGCFFHPKSCTGDDCIMAVTYEDDEDGTYSFEMFGKSTNGAGYISTGLSKDKKMGDDDVFMCSIGTDQVNVHHYYNPEYFTVMDFTSGFAKVQTSYMNGNIYCRFTRHKNSNLYQKPNLNFDLSKVYYLHMAWGKTYPTTGQAAKHDDLPVTTFDHVLLHDRKLHTIQGSTRTDSSGASTLCFLQSTIIIYILRNIFI
ncbi:putative ferric-chelate reductase 1 [Patella vulgata]|uniref:putative ferric-chelate reductase 1 n=1 Tax=Patella vulgata TaxID=6465 RepID=UPI0024A9DA60|nr:putative ferric-chelate reductase 1 [Patella vulgata]